MQQVLSKEEISIFYTTLGKNFYVKYNASDPNSPNLSPSYLPNCYPC